MKQIVTNRYRASLLQRRINRLKIAGLPISAISEMLSLSTRTVTQALMEQSEIWKSENLALRDEYVKKELFKLDHLEQELLEYADKAENFDIHRFVLSMTRVLTRRSRLLGLDAPTRIDLYGRDPKDDYKDIERLPDEEIENILKAKKRTLVN